MAGELEGGDGVLPDIAMRVTKRRFNERATLRAKKLIGIHNGIKEAGRLHGIIIDFSAL